MSQILRWFSFFHENIRTPYTVRVTIESETRAKTHTKKKLKWTSVEVVDRVLLHKMNITW